MSSAMAARMLDSRASGFALVLLLLGIWETLSRSIPGLEFLLPPFSTVASALGDMVWSGELSLHTIATLKKFLYGYACAIALGVPLGILIGYFRPLYNLTEPTLELLRPAPAIAILPLAVLILGLDLRMQTFVIAWAAFWPILSSSTDGVRSIDPILLDTARTYGYRGGSLFRRVVLPGGLPYAMSGLRLGLTFALILAVFVEMFTSGSGLGSLISHYRETLGVAEVYAAIIAVALLGYALNEIFVRLEKRLIRWHHVSREAL